MRGISWIAEELLASQEELSYMESKVNRMIIPCTQSPSGELVGRVPALCETRRFITVFTRACYCSLPRSTRINFTACHSISLSYSFLPRIPRITWITSDEQYNPFSPQLQAPSCVSACPSHPVLRYVQLVIQSDTCLRPSQARLQNCEKRLLASCPSVCMKQLRSHWTDFDEIFEYLSLFQKVLKKFKFH